NNSHPDIFQVYAYRVCGVVPFLIIVIYMCVKSHLVIKGKSQKRASSGASPSNHIYDNDP
ncbi:hypothetical protein ILYODFUR_019643, partial [Ilyodon furcidens]